MGKSCIGKTNIIHTLTKYTHSYEDKTIIFNKIIRQFIVDNDIVTLKTKSNLLLQHRCSSISIGGTLWRRLIANFVRLCYMRWT